MDMARISKAKPAQFSFYAPQAKKVTVAGNFNNWDIKALTAKRDSKGNWVAKANLKPGKYEYKFFVDGHWVNDPKCTSCVPNGMGSCNCTLEIR